MSDDLARIEKRLDELAADVKQMRSWMNQQKGKAALLMGAGLLVGAILTGLAAFWNGKP